MRVTEKTPGRYIIEAGEREIQTIRWIASFALTLEATVLSGQFMGTVRKIHAVLDKK